jgi:thiol-disulfide isomerase/thioredoxin
MKKLILSLFIQALALTTFNAHAQEIQKWKLSDMKAAIKNADKPTIFNFWATFCVPCMEEVPYFQELVKKYDSAGVRLVFISVDPSENFPQKLNTVTSRFDFKYPVKFLDETDADLFCPAVDKTWSGAIPASLFVNNKTGYHKFFEEQLSKVQLEKEIKAMVASKKKQ